MEYRRSGEGASTVYRFSGPWTFNDHETVETVADEIRRDANTAFVFDLSAVTFMDSSALGMLLLAQEAARERNATIALRGMQGNVENIMRLAKFDRLFTLPE